MAQTQLEEILAILGGEETLGARAIRSDRDLDALIHEGVPVAALDHAIAVLGATQVAVLEGVGIARSTLRRRKGGERRLDVVESERTVRLGKVASGRLELMRPSRPRGGQRRSRRGR